MAKKLPPVHPGEILREEFLVPLKLTPYAVAAALDVPRTRIERIAREEKPVTADTALRLGKFFKTGAAFWKRPKTCSRRRSRRSRLTRGRENWVRNSKWRSLGESNPCFRRERATS
jgi:antitoxin HigA-1